MNQKLESRRIKLYIAIAYGIAIIVGLVVYLLGGMESTAATIPGTPIPVYLPLVAVFYMGAPAIANILTRLLTHEGWHDLYLKPKFKGRWFAWLAAWFGPGLMTIFGVAVFFLLFPQYFDPQLGRVSATLSEMGDTTVPAGWQNPWLILAFLTLRSMLLFSLVNSLATFGEEFGWRAYLLQKMLPLGWKKAMLLMGIIWGIWHWPIIAMGHNYGTNYTGFPWAGMLMMVVFTFSSSVFLSWAALRGGSVWPAVLGHGAVNAIARLYEIMSRGEPSPLLGPGATGIVAMTGYILIGLWLFFRYKPEHTSAASHAQMAAESS